MNILKAKIASIAVAASMVAPAPAAADTRDVARVLAGVAAVVRDGSGAAGGL